MVKGEEMKVLELVEYGKLEYKEVEKLVYGENEVLIRVKACAIYGSREYISVAQVQWEKNIDITIACRFKLRGMRWSKEGASNLLALRLLYLNKGYNNYFYMAA